MCGQQEIQAIDREETALEGYMIEIIKMMLNIHQVKQKEEEKRVRKQTIEQMRTRKLG